MNPGGTDTILPGSGSTGEGTFIVSTLRRSWPALVVQDAAKVHTDSMNDLPAGIGEFFVYRSRAAFESWAKEGASYANADTMIHVILGATSTTFVTGNPGSETFLRVAEVCREVIFRRERRDP